MAGTSGIEIVLRDCPLDRVESWLSTIADPLSTPTDAGGASVYGSRLGIVVVQPHMEGPGGIGIWFKAENLPWMSAAACARQVARELGCVVWCDPGEDYPAVHPLAPVLLQIDGHEERLVELPDFATDDRA